MIIHYGYENLNLVSPVATLGIFDGVHLGHLALLKYLSSCAHKFKGESVVVTFSPHPRLVLDKVKSDLSFLTTLQEKEVLLEKAGIDHLIIIEFNEEFSRTGACDFIRDILIKKIGTKHLVVGYNHHFGRKGEGDFNTIKKCSDILDFSVDQVKGYECNKVTVSSSLIRRALSKGKVEEANRWLGYVYSISGIVIKGNKLGRTLGFPTANIKIDSEYKLIPANGVYVVDIQHDGNNYSGMLSIGSNPTVNNDPRIRNIEVHIFDFDKNIYGSNISVFFRTRLRDEIKFADTKKLTEQMEQDKLDSYRFLK